MYFIQLTDLHLRDPASSSNAKVHTAFVSECFDRLAAMYKDAACCVITGDLADLGERAAYQWLKPQLAKLPFPTHLLIGNHDSRAEFGRVFDMPDRGTERFVQGAIDLSPVRLVFLDTVTEGSDAGTLCAKRLKWLDECLQASGDKPVLLFMHHPACRIGDAKLDAIRLDNPDPFARVLARSQNVRHIFFGHVHRDIFVDWCAIPSTGLNSLTVKAQNGQAEFELPARIITLDGDDIRINRRVIHRATKAVSN